MKNIKSLVLPPNGDIPNNQQLPVLIYRRVIDKYKKNKKEIFKYCFHKNNWCGVWEDTIYKFCHFHSNTHEALGIARGKAKVRLGGGDGEAITLNAGDLLVLPAGTGHQRISATKNLIVLGAYPRGQGKYNMCKSVKDCRGVFKKIAAVPNPKSDPWYGSNGPLLRLWK